MVASSTGDSSCEHGLVRFPVLCIALGYATKKPVPMAQGFPSIYVKASAPP
jgi:hypothetical protein